MIWSSRKHQDNLEFAKVAMRARQKLGITLYNLGEDPSKDTVKRTGQNKHKRRACVHLIFSEIQV